MTLRDALARTEGHGAAAKTAGIETDPLADKYSHDPDTGTITVTLSGVELETATEAVGWAAAAALAADCATAFFEPKERADGSTFLANITPAFVAEHGERHPVVAWAQNPANEAEALAWYAARVERSAA